MDKWIDQFFCWLMPLGVVLVIIPGLLLMGLLLWGTLFGILTGQTIPTDYPDFTVRIVE